MHPTHDLIARRAFAAAYQLTGSVMDAEDIRQEVLLEWLEMEGRGEARGVERPEAYCGKAAANKALNLLKRRSREAYPGEWLPEPLMDGGLSPGQEVDLSYGFLHLLSLLNAPERAVFILRESLELPFADIAAAVDLEAAHCRKLYERAQARLADKGRPQRVEPEKRQALVQSFLQAVGSGDFAAFQRLLHDDVVLWSDGGGKRLAAMKPILGVTNAFKFLMGIIAKNQAAGMQYGIGLQDNGTDLMVVLTDLRAGQVDTVVAFDLRDGIAHNIYLQRNPDKLQSVPWPGDAAGG